MTNPEGSPIRRRAGMDLDRGDVNAGPAGGRTKVDESQLEAQQPKIGEERMVYEIASGVANLAKDVVKNNKLSCVCCGAGCAACLSAAVLAFSSAARGDTSNDGVYGPIVGAGMIGVVFGAVFKGNNLGDRNRNRPPNNS